MGPLSKLPAAVRWLVSGALTVVAVVLPGAAVAPGWRIEPAPTPKSTTDALQSVSCADRFACMLVGESGVGARGGLLVERRAHGRWSLLPISTPTVAPGPDVTNGWVSCRARNDCTVVGNAYAAFVPGHFPPGRMTFAERWDGHTWHRESIPHATDGVELVVIDCRASLPCLAVGSRSSFGQQHPVLERRVAGRWHEVRLGAGTAAGAFDAVSCADQNLCLAVGNITEVWNGHTWRRGPDPARFTAPAAVSCSSDRTCVLVGAWVISSSAPASPVVERWSGGRWHIEATPPVPGAPDSELSGISCQRGGTCVAVGAGSNPSGTVSFPVIERRRDRHWTLQQPSPPPSTNSSLGGVSCTTSTCTAVGISVPTSSASGNAVPLIERYG